MADTFVRNERTSDMDTLDAKLILYIQNHCRKPFLDPIMIFITNFGNAVWFTAGFYLWLSGSDAASGKYILATLFLSWGLTSLVLKPLIGRTRVYHAVPSLVAIIPEPKDKAFPSAHAAMAFAGAFAILFHLPVSFGIAAMAFALIMGYSRMYVGVHYLSDVLGGLVTGLTCAGLLIMIELI